MNKTKILFRFGMKATKKVLKGDFRYKGRSFVAVGLAVASYGAKSGPKALIRRMKHEIVSIDKRLGSNLAFPNGLTTGVAPHAIKDWYKISAKPVTIVIPSYNDEVVLVPCIESLKQTTNPKHVKIIIVDDYCQPSSRAFLEKLADDQVHIIYREKNGGFAKAVNTGLKAVEKLHDAILVNSDIVAHPGWLEALQYGAYEFGVKTGIVGPKLLYPDGRIQSGGSHRNTESPEWFDHYYRFQDANYGPANIPHYTLAMTGACLYMKREFMNKVGILDEDFQFAFEDVDICLRGWEAGYRTLYFPASTLTHVESATRAKNQTMTEKEKQSIKYFWKKWGSWFDERNVIDASGKRKIIFVLQSFGLSGGIKNIFEIANRLTQRGFTVEVWGLDKNPPTWPVDPTLTLRTYKNYERLIAALEPLEAIKVATWWETAFPVWLSSVKNGVPVYMVQEFETWFYPDDIVAQASVVSCYRKEFRNITISSYNLDELRAIGLDATLIPCGFDDSGVKAFKGVKREDDVLLGLGRSFFQKNFDMTLKGWKLLGEKRPRMWLYGAEPEIAKKDKHITYFTKPSNHEVDELRLKSTVFVQTSIHEGFCIPILEAMAAGCPVVCTDAHGNRDFCVDGKNCLMVDQNDAEGLKKALDRLFGDKGLRDRLAKEGLKTVKNYRWNVIMDKAEKFFSEVQ